MLLLSPNRSTALQSSTCVTTPADLHAVCGPRNAFAPGPSDDADRPEFFRPDEAPWPGDPDGSGDRWDGLA